VAKGLWIDDEPKVAVFDVNETLLDLEAMNALFERLFRDRRVPREWFGHLTLYAMTITVSGLYEDSFSLGQGVLQMVGSINHVDIAQTDLPNWARKPLGLRQGMHGLRPCPILPAGDSMLSRTLCTWPTPSYVRRSTLSRSLGYTYERALDLGAVRS
jgi:hypothetical protein